MNHRVLLVLLLVCGAYSVAQAETEGFAYPCGASACFWRRPIVEPPPGWVRDEDAGAHFQFNAFARQGEEFVNAAAVMYANAVYRKNAAPTLAEQVAQDKDRILKADPRSSITDAPSMQNADAKRLTTLTFTPSEREDSWDTVAYDEEGDYYLRFVLSARTKEAHDKALDAFVALVRGYSAVPRKP